jgi:hypothetical protein
LQARAVTPTSRFLNNRQKERNANGVTRYL